MSSIIGTTNPKEPHLHPISDRKHPSNKFYYSMERRQLISNKYHQHLSYDPISKAQLERCYMTFSSSATKPKYMSKPTLRSRYTKTTRLLGMHLRSTECYSKWCRYIRHYSHRYSRCWTSACSSHKPKLISPFVFLPNANANGNSILT
jgi:hypothetical protein